MTWSVCFWTGPKDIALLLEPTPRAVLEALDRAIVELSGTPESMLVFYYSGHSDERALYPGGQAIEFSALKKRLEHADVSVRIGIIDSCRGGGWTGARGLKETEPFEVPDPFRLSNQGSVLIASSSGHENAHESETIGGGFFTHHWNAALRGGADQNDDNVVTLTEAFEYAKRLTIRDTALPTGEAQHPSFLMNLRGRQDLPLVRLPDERTALSITPTHGPVKLIHLESGLVVLEVPQGDRQMDLVVRPAKYLLRIESENGPRAKEIEVREGEALVIQSSELDTVIVAEIATRHDRIRAVDRTTLAASDFEFQLSVGVNTDSDGVGIATVLDRMFVHGVLASYAITDRLQWLVGTGAFAYRLGDRGKTEWVPWGGLTGWGVGYDSESKFSATFPLSLGLSVRHWTGTTNWLVFGADLHSAVRFGDGGSGPDTWRIGGRLGYTHTVGGIVTFSLGVRYEQFILQDGVYRSESAPVLVFGSVLGLGTRSLPLIRLHLGDVVSLDSYLSFAYAFERGTLEESYGLGVTITW